MNTSEGIGAVSLGFDATTLTVVAVILVLAIAWGAWKLAKVLWLMLS